jgi:hypothetical protein
MKISCMCTFKYLKIGKSLKIRIIKLKIFKVVNQVLGCTLLSKRAETKNYQASAPSRRHIMIVHIPFVVIVGIYPFLEQHL